MDSNEGNADDLNARLTIQALDQGCLQELFSRCETHDLPVLAQTCKPFRELLAESELVWAQRLSTDYGINLHVHNSLPGALFPLAKQIYTASKSTPLRFQGLFVNGSVDDMNMWYWVDNLFKKDRSYFCSDASNNVDCLGLLLDGDVEREKKYSVANAYMRRRCRYGAALFEHINHPELADDDNLLMNLVEEWSDQQLENFFLSLVENLQQDFNNPIGRLLFYDIPEDRIAVEEERIGSVAAYLRDRLSALKKDLIILPRRNNNINDGGGGGGIGGGGSSGSRPETLFDSTVLRKLQPEYPIRVSSIIYELHLSRAGSLTCPVRSGVIFVGIINRSLLKGLDAQTAAERLHVATKDPICTSFNGVDDIDSLLRGIDEGKIPDYAHVRCDEASGVWYEFEHEGRKQNLRGEDGEGKLSAVADSSKASSSSLISWKPVVWFKFNSAEEAGVAYGDEDVDSLTQGEEDDEEEEEEPSSSANPVAAAGHGPHSGAGQNTDSGEGGQQQQQQQQQQDPWTDAELEEMSQGQPLIYAPAAAAGAGAAAPVAMAEGGSEDEEQEQEGDEELPAPPFIIDHTLGRNELHVILQRPVVANVIMVKLINQENLMDELMDGHAYPNIDMTYVHIVGKKIVMPPGIDLKKAK